MPATSRLFYASIFVLPHLNVSLLPALNRPPRRELVITTEAAVDSQIVVVVAPEQVNDAQMRLPALIAIQ